jgi:hypothetical protein
MAFSSAFALACAAGYGCGSTVDGSGSTGTGGASAGTGAAQGSTSVGATTSGVGGNASSSGSTGTGGPMLGCVPKDGAVLAVTKFYYGDTNFDGTPDKTNGWKQYGFNLDGKVSTATSTDLCKPLNNAAPKNVYPDGDNGIDNAFGKSVLPIFLAIASGFSAEANAAITAGDTTLILDLKGLGAAADQALLAARIHAGAALGAAPKFDGSDCWPVTPEGLTNPADITSAKAIFPASSVVANHWDSGPTGATVRLQIVFSGGRIHLDVHHAHLTMELAADHQSATLGQLGGVIATADLVAEIKRVAGSFDPTLCTGPTIDSILAQMSQASDILQDGTQDPAKTCDAVSIGLGFTTTALSLGGIAGPSPTEPNPCLP